MSNRAIVINYFITDLFRISFYKLLFNKKNYSEIALRITLVNFSPKALIMQP